MVDAYGAPMDKADEPYVVGNISWERKLNSEPPRRNKCHELR